MSSPRRVPPPDAQRVENYARQPEFGPRILFLSGGTALGATSRALKHYTHNSIHLITPFDSGGSSASLREAFGMLGVGDLRSRLMALADESEAGNPNVKALFSHRLDQSGEALELSRELHELVDGSHPLVLAVQDFLRKLIHDYLRAVVEELPAGFDLRGASVGNLILVGGFLVHGRDLDAVLGEFSRLVSVRGEVRPTAMGDAHLVAVHANGERIVGQHQLGKAESLGCGPIVDLELVRGLADGAGRIELDADAGSLNLIPRADLICFPMGSFFGSVLANLLPRGMGRRICEVDSPKVFIPNTGCDPELVGYSLASAAGKLMEFVRRDAGGNVSVERILNFVLIDRQNARYDLDLDVARLEEQGICVLDLKLVGQDVERLDPHRLAEALLLLA